MLKMLFYCSVDVAYLMYTYCVFLLEMLFACCVDGAYLMYYRDCLHYKAVLRLPPQTSVAIMSPTCTFCRQITFSKQDLTQNKLF